MKEEKIDELLELVWTLREERKCALEHVIAASDSKQAEKTVRKMENSGLVSVKDSQVTLTDKGEKEAGTIIRRHRLAEMLLYEVFEVDETEAESSACQFEHVLSPGVTEHICTFLGHPPTCPHGKPIPRGECCGRLRTRLQPLVTRLSDLPLGTIARVVFISTPEHVRLDRLSSMGISPGCHIKLHQKHPAFVISVGETDLAVDEDIAHGIFVREVKM